MHELLQEPGTVPSPPPPRRPTGSLSMPAATETITQHSLQLRLNTERNFVLNFMKLYLDLTNAYS